MDHTSTPASGVQSADRLLHIIEELSLSPRGQTLTELSEAVQLHKSTTYRMLSTLAAWNYVFKDEESGKYRLTMRMFEIGSRAIGGTNLLSVARPYLEHLYDETDEAIHLVIRDGYEIVYIYKEDSISHSIRMSSRVGLRNPMYCTAVGKSILALLPHEEQLDIWNNSVITPFTPKTITTFESMEKECQLIYERGYALDDEEHERGIRCVAAAICNFSGEPIGALSVSAPAFRLDDSHVKKYSILVMDAAKSIARLLGFS